MFTLGAIILTGATMVFANRMNEADRATYDRTPEDQQRWLVALHTRQDLKLIAFLLAGILVALGVIADRVG